MTPNRQKNTEILNSVKTNQKNECEKIDYTDFKVRQIGYVYAGNASCVKIKKSTNVVTNSIKRNLHYPFQKNR